MTPPDIRRAVAADLLMLAKLRCAFWDSQVQAGLVDGRDLSEAGLEEETRALIARPRTALLLAAEAEGPGGYVLAALQIVPARAGSPVVLVEELFVRPGRLRRGLGRALAERAIAELAAGPAPRLQARVLAGNAAGRAFWDRLGFRDALVTMERGGGGGD